MNHLVEYSRLLTFMYPIFSGVTCGLLLLFSMGDSLTHTEISLKRLVIAYLFTSSFNWLGSFLFGYAPNVFVYINVLLLASYIYDQVILYRFFHLFTHTDNNTRFSPWHHLMPILLCSILLVWSFFVPYDIQLQIVQSKGILFPEGYEAYGRYFTSKPLIRLIFSVIYTSMIFARLMLYYRKVNSSPNLIRKPARWVIFLGALMVVMVIAPVVGTFTPREIVFTAKATAVAAFAVFCQQILLSYHVLKRDYLFFVTFPAVKKDEAPDINRETDKMQGTKPRKTYTRKDKPLSKRAFESYMSRHKPFLNPEFKIADLAEAMDTNRTYISNFLNNTYGINFNRYINRRRLRELERLRKLPSNIGKAPHDLFDKAGFSTYKQYKRTKDTEEGDIKQKDNNKNK